MKFGSLIFILAALVLVCTGESFANAQKITCDSKRGAAQVKIEITPSPFAISLLKQSEDNPTKWEAMPFWDESHRCATAVSDDELNSTQCELNDGSTDGFLDLKFGCYPSHGDASEKYVWGEVAIQQTSGKGIFNCVSSHFELRNCKSIE